MSRSVSAKDVAAAAEVSVVTVSRAINNHPNVASDIRQRVLHVASELGYYGRKGRQNGQQVEQWPAEQNTTAVKNVELLCAFSPDHVHGPFWPAVMVGVEQAIRRANLHLSLRFIGNDQGTFDIDQAVQQSQTDGILLLGPADEHLVSHVKAAGRPFVLIDNHIPNAGVDSVIADNVEGTRAAIAYLIAQGHRDIACIGGPVLPGSMSTSAIYTFRYREMAYRSMLLEAGIPVNPLLFEACAADHNGYEACQRLLAREVPFSAVFCMNDPMAIDAIRALRDHNIRIPEDVSVVGFDDIDVARHVTPALTTVGVPKQLLGATAVERLIYRAQHPETPAVLLTLPVSLVVRGSVAPLA